jgi:hypothetical protein
MEVTIGNDAVIALGILVAAYGLGQLLGLIIAHLEHKDK